MIGIIYKFTILAKYKFDGHRPFYVGQHFGLDDFDTYPGSGIIWTDFIDRMKKDFPTCWRKLIKREVLYQRPCSQIVLDTMEAYYIKKEHSHYSYRKGGCNVLWGTANRFGSINPSKIKMCSEKQSESLKKWWNNHPEERIKLSKRRRGNKSSNETKKKISNSLKGMFLGEKNPMWHKKVSEETKKKMSISQSRRKHRKPHTEETKRKISQSRMKYVGEKHPLYGSTFIWITNGIENKRFNGKLEEIPTNWRRGKNENKKI